MKATRKVRHKHFVLDGEAEARAFAGLICRSPSSVDAFIAFARCEARALLLDRRRAVRRIADALLVHRTLKWPSDRCDHPRCLIAWHGA